MDMLTKVVRRGLLIDSWTLVARLNRRKRPNKGTDLGAASFRDVIKQFLARKGRGCAGRRTRPGRAMLTMLGLSRVPSRTGTIKITIFRNKFL